MKTEQQQMPELLIAVSHSNGELIYQFDSMQG